MTFGLRAVFLAFYLDSATLGPFVVTRFIGYLQNNRINAVTTNKN
jgi:hypothetical protein